MPNLKPVDAFTRQLTQIESVYLDDVQAALRDARAALLEAIMRDVSNLAITARREFDALYSAVSGIATNAVTPLEETVLALVEKQFDLVNRFYPDQPASFQQAVQGTAGRRQDILSGYRQTSTAWLDTFQAQFLTELSRLRAADEELQAIADRLLANDIATTGRVSIWRSGGNLAALESQRSLWEAAAALVGPVYLAGQTQTGERWQKQAIAALDEKTTDCCLQVHGQIRDLDQPFTLTGTPRFADEIMSPPFHYFCRTVESLYLVRFEQAGVTTAEMRDAAAAEIAARQDGSRVEISPASATSRRG